MRNVKDEALKQLMDWYDSGAEDRAGFETLVKQALAAQRQWVGLTDAEVKHRATFIDKQFHLAFYAGMYQAQQILKEKNT